MQIFILGKTKSGKSTLAHICKENDFTIYEAGAWARKEFDTLNTGSKDEFSVEFKENLTNYALGKLKEDSYYSVKKYEEFLKDLKNLTGLKNIHNEKKLIVGVRNPDDFLQMLRMDKNNKVIFIKSKKQFTGSLELFEEGLEIIKQYLDWRLKLGNAIDVIEINEEDINDKQLVMTMLKGKL